MFMKHSYQLGMFIKIKVLIATRYAMGLNKHFEIRGRFFLEAGE